MLGYSDSSCNPIVYVPIPSFFGDFIGDVKFYQQLNILNPKWNQLED